MTIKVCHNKFNEVADKICHVLWITAIVIWTSVKYILVGLTIYSIIQLQEHYIWGMGIMIFGLFSAFAWIVHLMNANYDEYDNDLVKLNKKLHIFAWNEDC